MTWQTSEGDRYLIGEEADLLRDALAVMLDRIHQSLTDGPFVLGVDLFDTMQPTQQLAATSMIVKHLLLPTPTTPPLTAVHEATVYAAYRLVLQEIEDEVEFDGPSEFDADMDAGPERQWRLATWRAYRAGVRDDMDADWRGTAEDGSVPGDLASIPLDQWEEFIEDLADQVLWDRDFLIADVFLDANPDDTATMKNVMGIDIDHFATPSGDLAIREAEQVYQSARDLIRRKPH